MRFGYNIVIMATLTIKNLPDTVYTALKRTAVKHRRSLNSEAIVRLEQSLASPTLNVAETLAEIRRLRLATSGHILTEADILEAKNEGRP